MKFKSNEMGFCPYCNDGDLVYGSVVYEDNMCYFPWICNKCGHQGEEWYTMEFAGHNVITEDYNTLEITDNMIGDNE